MWKRYIINLALSFLSEIILESERKSAVKARRFLLKIEFRVDQLYVAYRRMIDRIKEQQA